MPIATKATAAIAYPRVSTAVQPGPLRPGPFRRNKPRSPASPETEGYDLAQTFTEIETG